MFYEPMIDTEDKSYYADRLEEITGRPRNHWTNISLLKLHDFLRKELMKEKGASCHDTRALL